MRTFIALLFFAALLTKYASAQSEGECTCTPSEGNSFQAKSLPATENDLCTTAEFKTFCRMDWNAGSPKSEQKTTFLRDYSNFVTELRDKGGYWASPELAPQTIFAEDYYLRLAERIADSEWDRSVYFKTDELPAVLGGYVALLSSHLRIPLKLDKEADDISNTARKNAAVLTNALIGESATPLVVKGEFGDLFASHSCLGFTPSSSELPKLTVAGPSAREGGWCKQ